MYFDTHAHYNDSKFDEDRYELLDSMLSKNIGMIIVPGCNTEDSKKALDLAERYSYVYAAVGIHPEDMPADIDADIPVISAFADSPECVAIGEIGLDYYWDASEKDKQILLFQKQLELAQEKNLPVIIHDREAHADCLNVVKQFNGIRGVFHCYSGSAEMADILLNSGWYLGFDGPVTYKNARKALEVIEICPLDRMLLETDSPYLPPVPMRGTRNDSGNLPFIAQKIAEVKKISPEEVESSTFKNALELFNIG